MNVERNKKNVFVYDRSWLIKKVKVNFYMCSPLLCLLNIQKLIMSCRDIIDEKIIVIFNMKVGMLKFNKFRVSYSIKIFHSCVL